MGDAVSSLVQLRVHQLHAHQLPCVGRKCIDFRPTSVTNRAIRRRMTRPPDDFNGRARHMERDEGRSFRTEQEQTAITTPSEGVRARLARELRAGTLSAEVLALFDATDSQKQADLALRRRTVSAHDLD